MSDGVPEGAPEAPPLPSSPSARAFAALKRQLRRPVVAFALVLAGFALLFPRFGPREVVLRHRVPAAGCAKKLVVAAYEDEQRVRSSAHLLRGEPVVTHAFTLPKGRYSLRIELHCARGAPATLERTLMLEENGALDFDLSTECPC